MTWANLTPEPTAAARSVCGRIGAVSLILLLSLGAFTSKTCGAEIKARVVDGLGQPLAEATIHVELTEKTPEGKVTKVERFDLLSDRNGLVRGRYDDAKISTNDVLVSIAKTGYAGFSTGELQKEYVLKRSFGPRDIRRIARLRGAAQESNLKEMLAGDYEPGEGEDGLFESIFLYYRELGPALRVLLTDAKVAARAAEVLSFIGVPQDLRLVIKHAPSPKRELFEDRWAYEVACALLEPATEAEWEFLRRCAFNEYEDSWVDAGAINSLRLIGSQRSLNILQEAKKNNPSREEMIDEALKYIESKPRSLSHTNLVEAGNAVAQAIRIGKWEGNKEPRLNDEGDMALVECEFTSGRDRLTYTATFHQVAGVWTLRGVRETMQALMGLPPDRSDFIGNWHGYSSSHLEFGRLELREDGTGLLAISELPNSPPYAYRIPKWSLKGFQLAISVEPAEPEAELITLTNVFLGSQALELELHGKTGWEIKMTLLNEKELQRRASAAKESLEKFSKPERKE